MSTESLARICWTRLFYGMCYNKLTKSEFERGDCMKNVVISADGDRKVYSVPDVVANDLSKYC